MALNGHCWQWLKKVVLGPHHHCPVDTYLPSAFSGHVYFLFSGQGATVNTSLCGNEEKGLFEGERALNSLGPDTEQLVFVDYWRIFGVNEKCFAKTVTVYISHVGLKQKIKFFCWGL